MVIGRREREREKKGGRSKEKAHTLKKTTVTISIVSKRDGWCC